MKKIMLLFLKIKWSGLYHPHIILYDIIHEANVQNYTSDYIGPKKKWHCGRNCINRIFKNRENYAKSLLIAFMWDTVGTVLHDIYFEIN